MNSGTSRGRWTRGNGPLRLAFIAPLIWGYSSTDLGLLLHAWAWPFPLVKPFTLVRAVILGFTKL